MTALAISPQDQAQAIVDAGNHWGVPFPVLTGIYGAETSWGTNIDTSSAGAIGAMQFLPSTAQSYNYPQTNAPNLTQFRAQMDAAAHFLKDHHTGGSVNTNWSDAVFHYNPSTAYVNEVGRLMKQTPADLGKFLAGKFQTSQTGSSVLNVPNPLKGVEAIGALLTSTSFWIRLGEGIAGVVLIALGLRSMTGSPTTPISLARTAVKVAR